MYLLFVKDLILLISWIEIMSCDEEVNKYYKYYKLIVQRNSQNNDYFHSL